MSLRLILLVTVLFALLVAYLSSLNTEGVRVAIARDWAYDLPVMALVVGAFLAGAAVVFALSAFRDLGRTFRTYRQARRARRAQALGEIYQRGLEAQLARRLEDAGQAYGEVLRRDPAHADASLRLGELARQRGDVAAALEHDHRALSGGERTGTLLAVADDYRRLARFDEATGMYRRALGRDPENLTAWRALRDVAVERARWAEGLEAQERLDRIAPREERSQQEMCRLGIEYELGRALAASGDAPTATARFKDVLRARPDFVPAAVALGDVLLQAGDPREATRVWERALQGVPAAPLLSRIERLYRAEGRPARMVSLYEDAVRRHPNNLAIAFALGRVYFELAMLDEAADQFQKLEVRAPQLSLPRAYLGAIFERHGQMRDACEEYRRALGFPESIDWPHRCAACGATRPSWFDRCFECQRWNTSQP